MTDMCFRLAAVETRDSSFTPLTITESRGATVLPFTPLRRAFPVVGVLVLSGEGSRSDAVFPGS